MSFDFLFKSYHYFMKMNEVIDRISYFRNQKGLTAKDLSLSIDKHEGYINKLEAKDFNLPTKNLLLILEVLEISPAEFFSDNYKTYESDNQLADLISKLSKEKRELLINFLEK